MRHAGARVEGELPLAIEGSARRREDLADPIRNDAHECLVRDGGQSLEPPRGKIGYEDGVAALEMEFGLRKEDPAARAAQATAERTVQQAREACLGLGIPQRGTRARAELALDDLGDDPFRRREDILVAGAAALRARGHAGRLPTEGRPARVTLRSRIHREGPAALQKIERDNVLALLPKLQERLCHFRPNPATSP